MSLDWSNERYVRLYARLTPDMAAWAWQAKAVWPWVLVCADGAGIIETAKGARGVAAVLAGGGFPLDVVEAGLSELIADGCLEARPDGRGYVVRNYVEAQTATMTDTARKARQRDRERAERARCGAQDAGTSPADPGHAPSRQVTPCHAESRGDRSVTPDVTPSRAEPKEEDTLTDARARDRSDPGQGSAQAPPPVDRSRDVVAETALAMHDAWCSAGRELAAKLGRTAQVGGAMPDPRHLAAIRLVVDSWAIAARNDGRDLPGFAAETMGKLVAVRSAKALADPSSLRWWAAPSFWPVDGIERDLGDRPEDAAARVRPGHGPRDRPPAAPPKPRPQRQDLKPLL